MASTSGAGKTDAERPVGCVHGSRCRGAVATPIDLRSLLVLPLAVALALLPSACKAPQSEASANGSQPATAPSLQVGRSAASEAATPLVLTTFTVLADMAREVAGPHLRVASITRLGAEIHGYQVTPGDIERGQGASLILDNGLGLERWARRFNANLPGVPRVTLSAGIEPLPITADSGRGKPNPHAWMSPANALIYVENIRAAMTALMPQRAPQFAANARNYSNRIRALDLELRQAISAIPPERRLLVSCEGAFSYLASDYGLDEAYLWPVNAERQVTPQRMARLIRTVKDRAVPAIFCESTVSSEAQKQVAAESGSRFGGVFYVDSLSGPRGPAASYLDLLRHNVDTLVRGLEGQPR
ncbi:MAG: metal ABC transporter substrate-binding protein [Aphanocapsa feldmannii 277cV]|uniref:Metal ABC transporter substrate-binding protein n=1 Tax=Aphanocapsa feldmannii 277cV TaxID=2507553 RepID=A0A524RNS8_9CHRO|nr:MAG: metal ABC transporter substrate-binding protein [Aphanocapsa feldmannii 277cV]